jgi:hypothetical protein
MNKALQNYECEGQLSIFDIPIKEPEPFMNPPEEPETTDDYIKENPSQSNHICRFLEEVAEWGDCLKRMDKVWPCIPSKPLTKTGEICFENRQLHICYEYLTRSGYFADCAVSHAIRIQDNIIRHYEDCELEFSDIATIQSKTLHTNKTLSNLENRFLRVMKELLLHQMKICPQKYSKSDIQFCLNEQIFSPDDLLAQKIIKEDFLYHSYEDNQFLLQYQK